MSDRLLTLHLVYCFRLFMFARLILAGRLPILRRIDGLNLVNLSSMCLVVGGWLAFMRRLFVMVASGGAYDLVREY